MEVQPSILCTMSNDKACEDEDGKQSLKTSNARHGTSTIMYVSTTGTMWYDAGIASTFHKVSKRVCWHECHIGSLLHNHRP